VEVIELLSSSLRRQPGNNITVQAYKKIKEKKKECRLTQTIELKFSELEKLLYSIFVRNKSRLFFHEFEQIWKSFSRSLNGHLLWQKLSLQLDNFGGRFGFIFF